MQGESGRLMDAPGQEQQGNDSIARRADDSGRARRAWRCQKSSTYQDLGSGRALGVRI